MRLRMDIGTVLRGVLLSVIGVALKGAIFAQSLTWLGTWGSGSLYYAEAHGVSADGTVVAGWGGVYSPHVAFRWTRTGGMQDIGQLASGHDTEAWGISDDGRVIVGYGFISSNAYRGFRWENGVFTQFGTFGGSNSWAWDASADGSVIVGSAALNTGFNRAFRWTAATGMVNLGTLPDDIRSVARAVSADGSVVVGWSSGGFGHRAFRWANGVMTNIHNPALYESEAIGVSGDGNVVVGAWGPNLLSPAKPFRWTAEEGMVNLGTLGGQWGEAWDANDDGSIVVGWSELSSGNWHAFRWTVSGGMEDLNVTYASLLGPGDILEWAAAISPDGRYIVGNGTNGATGDTEAFLLDTWRTGDTNGDGCIDDSDLLAVLFAFGTPGTGLTRHEDINKDGIVDDADLLIVLFNFGQGC